MQWQRLSLETKPNKPWDWPKTRADRLANMVEQSRRERTSSSLAHTDQTDSAFWCNLPQMVGQAGGHTSDVTSAQCRPAVHRSILLDEYKVRSALESSSIIHRDPRGEVQRIWDRTPARRSWRDRRDKSPCI